jgi:ribonucleoside-triphosphate reductase
MLTCKFGNWWEENPQRGRANNSAMILRHKIKKKEFLDLWKKVEASNSGEPGIYFSNDKDSGTNPCCEISLRPYQFCNLCELNVSDITSQEDLNERAKSATFIGTLQASYTNFHYLRDIWKKTTEKDALIGVGMTGIASGAILNFNLEEAANIVKQENERVAKLIGINKAARTTTIKPSGTSSLVLGTSSGIHAWHDNYYIRRVRIGKNESLYTYLLVYHNELLEDDYFKPNIQSVVSIPQKSPEGSILRTESALNLLERVKKFNIEWVKTGHRKGENTNNVSATISIKENEWEEIGNWMWDNRFFYNGLSVLPYDSHSYVQSPFESCSKEKYEELIKSLHQIDLTKVIEIDDHTNLMDQSACAGNNCEIM